MVINFYNLLKISTLVHFLALQFVYFDQIFLFLRKIQNAPPRVARILIKEQTIRHNEQHIPQENPFKRVCHDTVVAAAVCTARISDAAYINILLPAGRGLVHHRRAQVPFHTRTDNNMPYGVKHTSSRHYKRLLGTPTRSFEAHMACCTQFDKPGDNTQH